METLTMDLMNTRFFISVSNANVKNWRTEIIEWLTYVDREWSRFRADNELAALNLAPKGAVIRLSAPLYDALECAHYYFELTDGLFSPYLKRQMEQNGYAVSFPFLASRRNVPDDQAETHEDQVETPPLQKHPYLFLGDQLVKKNTDSEIDLGGFAKGYAVESAARWLKDTCGAVYGIVNGGGDLKVWSDGEKEWKIGISHPLQENKGMGIIRLKNGAVATSNRIYRSWKQKNERKHHLLNGKTGLPAVTDVVQATVVASSLLAGEVAAKMCFLLEDKEREDWLKRHFPDCSFYLVKEKDRAATGQQSRTEG